MQVPGIKLSHKSSPNILMTFGTLYDNVTLCKKCVATFWAFFGGGGKLGNFLFHHLVTLDVTRLMLSSDQKQSAGWRVRLLPELNRGRLKN